MKIDKQTYRYHVQTFQQQDTIFREGDAGQYMYIIMEGQVEIRKKISEHVNRTLVILQSGDIFGEMAVFDGKERTASAIANKPCKLLQINREIMYEMVKKNPDFAVKLIKILTSRLRNTNLILEEIQSQNLDKQVLVSLGKFIKAGDNPLSGSSIVFSKSEFCKWMSRHGGVSEKMASLSLDNLLNKKIIRSKHGETGRDYIVASKELLAKVVPLD